LRRAKAHSVSNKLTRIRVDNIIEKLLWHRGERSAWGYHYLCTNLTNREREFAEPPSKRV